MSAAVLEAPAATAGGADFTLEVNSKKPCVMCDATFRGLDKKGIAYTVGDAKNDAVRELGLSYGVMQAPFVVVRNAAGEIVDTWGGFNPPKIDEWAERLPLTPEAAAKKAAEIAAAEPLLAA